MDKLRMKTITFGCDPEVFLKKKILTKKGKTKYRIIGSERLIPENGLESRNTWDRNGKVIRDGVQIELNPIQSTCRANLGNYIKSLFKELDLQVKDKKGMSICFDQVVTITKKELMSLSPKSRQFGCMPSYNFYDTAEFKAGITVDPTKYLKRSGGGHIHLGSSDPTDSVYKALHNYNRIVPLLDLIVGNTCVMIDRNPLNAERRKVYGRAGEFRMPKYGVEYRTLSNFWLRDYQLFSFVTGLCRIAVTILASTTDKQNYYKELMDLVNIKDVQKAINDNDFNLAKKNWDKIKMWLANNMQDNSTQNYSSPIQIEYIPLIDYFISKGMDYWFTNKDSRILSNWCNQVEGHVMGFEKFLTEVVAESIHSHSQLDWHENIFDEDEETDEYEDEDENYDN